MCTSERCPEENSMTLGEEERTNYSPSRVSHVGGKVSLCRQGQPQAVHPSASASRVLRLWELASTLSSAQSLNMVKLNHLTSMSQKQHLSN